MNAAQLSYEHAVRASERRLAHAICSFKDGPGYQWFRSDEFPGFYAGNGILSDGTRPDLRIEDWVAIFREHFPNPPYRHVTLVFPEGTVAPALLDSARERGFRLFPELLMTASVDVLAGPQPSTATTSMPQLLDLTRDREALFDLHLSESISADWFEDAKSFRGLFNKTMALSERVGMEWLAIKQDDANGALASALGYFDEGPICRLQEVVTAPTARRRGLATCLIRDVATRAARREVSMIGLVAEEGEEGYRLYRSLGFDTLACDVTVMHY